MVQNDNRILLHACCAICSGYPISLLREIGYMPIVYFCNSNLDTEVEFCKRLEAQKKLCEYFDVELIVEPYNAKEFLDYVKGLEAEPEKGKRCDKCIEYRLQKTLFEAKKLGVRFFTTSLTISPHKNFNKIAEIGKYLNDVGVEFLPLDFKKKDGFLKTNNLSKELCLYRQRYCGCKFSK